MRYLVVANFRRRGIHLSAALVAVILVVDRVAADTEPRSPGSWSVQFQITDNLSLSQFNGATISLKRHFSEHSAFRLGIGFNARTEDQDGITQSPSDTTSMSSERSDVLSQFTLLFVRYRSPQTDTSLMWGIGPLVGYSRSKLTTTIPLSDVDKQRVWQLGVRALLGYEYMAASWLAIHAEYAIVLMYEDLELTERRELSGVVTSSEQNRQRWSMGPDRVLFGLSVYF